MLFLHLGLHKTGTTYFQHHVFPHWPSIHYLGRPFSGMWWKPIAASERDKYLISVESLLCRLRGDLVFNPESDWGEITLDRIRRLQDIFPNAYVMVAFRNTADWAYSLYGSYLRQGGTKTRTQFVGNESNCVMKVNELLNAKRLAAFEEAWGERFYPLLYSDLRENQEYFIRQLALIMQTPLPQADFTQTTHRNSAYVLEMEKAFRRLNRLDSGANVHEVSGSFNCTKLEKWRLFNSLGFNRESLSRRLSRFTKLSDDERAEVEDWKAWLNEVYADDWQVTEARVRQLQRERGITEEKVARYQGPGLQYAEAEGEGSATE